MFTNFLQVIAVAIFGGEAYCSRCQKWDCAVLLREVGAAAFICIKIELCTAMELV